MDCPCVCLCYLSCTIKSRRWRAIMREVDKGCSEFCVTLSTVGILIHSRLKALAVNLSQPSARLWLYAGLIGSNNPRWLNADRVNCANPSSSSSWVWVGECFFWYRLTWAVLDKGLLNGCVCVCIYSCTYYHSSTLFACVLWVICKCNVLLSSALQLVHVSTTVNWLNKLKRTA